MRDFFLDGKKCAHAWKLAAAELFDCFGDLFPMRRPSCAPISYGHLICLGAEAVFPENGEPNIKPFTGSIDEAIRILNRCRGMDFSQNEMYRHYLGVWEQLKDSFPDQDIPFEGFNHQGPVTSAVLMRGQDFLCDLYDEPDKCAEYMRIMTDSIIEFIKQNRNLNGRPEISNGSFVCDDFASLIAPDMWGEFVIPFWNRLYSGISNGGGRAMHVEDCAPGHLKYFKDAGITHFQPSVSDKITLRDIKDNLDPDITYDWLLYSYYITDMTDIQVQKWVDDTVSTGVSVVRTQFGAYTHQRGKLDRIKAFYKAFEKYKNNQERI
jgi:hypothetical protein